MKFFPTKPLPERNEPCPCDSGKKYKKCCLEKDRAEHEKILRAVTDNPTMRDQSAVAKAPDMRHPWERLSFRGVGKYAPTNLSTAVE